MRGYAFEDFVFDPLACSLCKSGEAVPLEPQVALVLNVLLENAGTHVSRAHLLDKVWEGRAVSPAVVDNRIRAVRLAIGDDGTSQRLIKTFPNKGYVFVGELTQLESIKQHDPVVSGSTKPKDAKQARGWRLPSTAVAALGFTAVIVTLSDFSILQEAEIPAAEASTGTTSTGVVENSIAVLPFGGRQSSDLDSYRALNIEGMFVADLTSAPGLKVISPLSSFRFKPDARAIDVSNSLGVHFIVTGELVSSQDQVNLMLRLSDARTDTVLVAETLHLGPKTEGKISLNPDLIHKASLQLLNRIGVSPGSSGSRLAPSSAATAFQHAYSILQQSRDAELLDAINIFAWVIEAEPEFFPAYRDIVTAYHLAAEYAGLELAEASRKIDTYALLVRDLLDESPDLFVIKGLQARYRGNLPEAIDYFNKALRMDDQHADAALFRAEVLDIMGDAGAADEAYAFALTFNPLSPRILSYNARSDFGRGLHMEAFSGARKNLAWNPQDIDAQIDLAIFYRETGQYDSSHKMLTRALSQNSRNFRAQFELLLLLRGFDRVELAHQFDLSPEIVALAYTFQGEEELARLAQRYDTMGISLGYLDYVTGNSTPLYEYFKTTGRLASFRSDAVEISSLFIFDAIFFADASFGNSDTDAEAALQNVRRYFSTRPLETLQSTEEFLAFAGLNALEGNRNAVNAVIEAAIERDLFFVGPLAQLPVFANVRDDPDFQRLLAQMRSRADLVVAALFP